MQHFSSPKTRLFYRKRRLRIRHVVLPLLGASLVYGASALITPALTTKPQAAPVQKVAAVIPQDVPAATPAPVVAVASITAAEGEAAARNLKAAFDAVPRKANYTYHAQSGASAESSSALSRKLASIQSGIDTILEASSEALTSTRTLVVGKGDTLMDLLVRNNVPRQEAHEAIAALSKIYDPRDLSPKHEVTVFFNRDPSIADPKFQGLAIEKDVLSTVTVNRADDGAYTVGEDTKDTERKLKAFRGDINSSLYVSAKSQGVPDGVILELIKLYSLNVDFQRDIQSGDAFEVMYEQHETASGDVVPGKSNVLFARLDLGDRSLPMYRFVDADGDTSYYDAEGKSAKRSIMKTPIDGARLSSGFGMRRHPVLGYSKMHKGVDFAAPRGTPIYAAGDGKIVKLGNFSSYGKYIKIRHQSGLETAYAHMNGYKAGLKNGARVKQGQIIGYVGTTGRSTGPHLHFEVIQNGKHVSPNSLKLPSGKALAGKELKAFKAQVAELDRQFKDEAGNAAVAAKTDNKVKVASKQ